MCTRCQDQVVKSNGALGPMISPQGRGRNEKGSRKRKKISPGLVYLDSPFPSLRHLIDNAPLNSHRISWISHHMLCTLAVAEYLFALLLPASPAHMCLQRSPLSPQPCGHSHRSNKCRGWGSRDGACALSTLRGDRHRRKTSQSGIDRLDRRFRRGIAFPTGALHGQYSTRVSVVYHQTQRTAPLAHLRYRHSKCDHVQYRDGWILDRR